MHGHSIYISLGKKRPPGDNSAMSAMQITLSEQQADFVRQNVDQGRFRDADEVIRTAIELLQLQEQQRREKLARLRQLIDEGFDAIERGAYETISDEQSLNAFMESVRDPSQKIPAA